jgi:hypothetical protein
MYANNVIALLQRAIVDGELVIDPDDDIVSGACVVHHGEVRHELARTLVNGSASHREERRGH